MKKTTLLLSVSLFAIGIVKGQDTTKVQKSDSAAAGTAAPPASPFTFNGYIDSYYLYNQNDPRSGDNLGQSGTARAFDQRANTIGIGLVQTKFGYSHKKSDVVVDLTFGPNADLGNYGNNPFLSWNSKNVAYAGTPGTPAGAFLGGIAIKQAYFNYKITNKLTFTAGQFGTHIGYEVIDAPINYNYSLSNLFNNGPFYHIGGKLNYAFSDKFSVMGGVVNDVDALYDNNKTPGYIGQIFLSPAKGWNVYINGITSNESNPDPVTGNFVSGLYSLLDLTTGYQITDKFYLGVNAAYGEQKGDYQGASAPIIFQGYDSTGTEIDSVASTTSPKDWGGVAVYSNFQFNKYFGLGVRAEYFDNTSGIRYLRNKYSNTGGTDVTSITVTAKIALDEGHIILKPEWRIDTFKKINNPNEAFGTQQFMNSSGGYSLNSQSTFGLALIYVY